ncbi:MAG: hypothetical protein QNJ31_01545 [Candidatus Caenarcaniphilales bacterium]|nr:hypothetical protein [Candidatus Caenarcaniphilales bacterium]
MVKLQTLHSSQSFKSFKRPQQFIVTAIAVVLHKTNGIPPTQIIEAFGCKDFYEKTVKYSVPDNYGQVHLLSNDEDLCITDLVKLKKQLRVYMVTGSETRNSVKTQLNLVLKKVFVNEIDISQLPFYEIEAIIRQLDGLIKDLARNYDRRKTVNIANQKNNKPHHTQNS